MRGDIPVPTGNWTGIVPSGLPGPLTSLCREGEGWERKTQFLGGKKTPPGHRVLQGLGDPAGKRDKIPLKQQAGTGWELPTLFNALEFFPFPSSSRCLGLGGTGSVSSWRPGMSPRCHLAQRLGGHSGGTFWLGSCFILGEEGSIPYPGVGIPRLQPSLAFCPAFLGHLDPHDAHSCHHAPSSGRGLLGTG